MTGDLNSHLVRDMVEIDAQQLNEPVEHQWYQGPHCAPGLIHRPQCNYASKNNSLYPIT